MTAQESINITQRNPVTFSTLKKMASYLFFDVLNAFPKTKPPHRTFLVLCEGLISAIKDFIPAGF